MTAEIRPRRVIGHILNLRNGGALGMIPPKLYGFLYARQHL